MAKVVALANQKGGVGKTTTAINLAASVAAHQKQVLLIDLDPQGNATMGSGVDKSQLHLSSTEVLLKDCLLQEATLGTENGFDLLPANQDLTVAEVELIRQDNREVRLLQALASVKTKYDYIFIDCPPAINTLTLNALVAANGVIIPMQCEYYALEGLAALLETITHIRASVNASLEIEGVLRTMYDARNRLCAEVSKQLLSHFEDRVYRTVIPRNVRLAEAPSHGMAALRYDKSSQGASAYMVLATEFLNRQTIVAKEIA